MFVKLEITTFPTEVTLTVRPLGEAPVPATALMTNFASSTDAVYSGVDA
jgi:hypothetical protein